MNPKKSKPAKKSVTGKSVSAEDLIDMQEAITLLKTTRPTFYRWLRTGKIQGMKIGRQWRFYRADIERFLKGEAPRIDLPADIKPFTSLLKKKLKEVGINVKTEKGLPALTHAARLLVLLAATSRASDIHIEPQFTDDLAEPVVHIRFRIDGILHKITNIDKRLLSPFIGEFKRIAECDLNIKERPQDGRAIFKLSDLDPKKYGDNDKTIDLRVSFLTTGLGEIMTARILDPTSQLINLDRIDYSPEQREIIDRHLKDPWGMIVISGPTGCGKTTNMYAFINEISGPHVKSMSVEDPIEYFLPWVNQIAVNEPAGVTFVTALKAIFRSDPDIILIGEIRDAETLLGAQQAALTGHLVMTQLHVNNTPEAIRRMIDIGKADPFVVAESMRMITSQRLVRKLCPDCSVKAKIPKDRLKVAKDMAESGGLKWKDLEKNFRSQVGCEKCNGVGFKRRNIITEVMDVTPAIACAIRDVLPAGKIRKIALSEGMVSMGADGIRKAARGETSLDEVIRVAGNIT